MHIKHYHPKVPKSLTSSPYGENPQVRKTYLKLIRKRVSKKKITRRLHLKKISRKRKHFQLRRIILMTVVYSVLKPRKRQKMSPLPQIFQYLIHFNILQGALKVLTKQSRTRKKLNPRQRPVKQMWN